MKKQSEIFAFSTPLNFFEEGEWLLAVTFVEATPFLKKMVKTIAFHFQKQNYWTSKRSEEACNELKEILQLRSQDVIDLLVEEVEKRVVWIKVENSGYKLTGFDHFKIKILARLGTVKYKDLEDMVSKKGFLYDEIIDIFDIKYITGSTKGYTLPPSIY